VKITGDWQSKKYHKRRESVITMLTPSSHRGRDRQTDRQREAGRERDREREREKDREREAAREREGKKKLD
jgi:hypothetical protein